MSDKHIKKTSVVTFGLIGLMVILAGVAIYFVKVVLSDDGPGKKSQVTVTLLKPPPPQPIKEKPPEPEEIKQVQKKEEVFTPEQQNVASQDSKAAGEQDNAPAGDSLGVDAEGTSGSDAFGLQAKKGGRSLIAGGGGTGGNGGSGIEKMNLMSKYSGYTQIVEKDIQKMFMKLLDEKGGVMKGKKAIVSVSLDKKGAVREYKIIGSSGDHNMDDMVMQVMGSIKISEPPPGGMPRKIEIKISSQG